MATEHWRREGLRPANGQYRDSPLTIAAQAGSQRRLSNWFLQPGDEAEGVGCPTVGIVLPGAKGQEVDTAEGGIRPDGAGEREAVHAGHVEVEHGQINGGRGMRGLR